MANKKRSRNVMLILLSALILIAVVILLIFDPRQWVVSRGATWALGNFALMNVAVYECFMLLLGGFITVTHKENRAAEEAAVNVKWLPRLLSIAVMLAAVVSFILVENIELLPLVWFDGWTWLFAALAAVQTLLVALSRKEYPNVTQ